MPFKSKKQKKTIDAAAHNSEFAKKVGIKVSDAKKMSAHGKGQTKFGEAVDTVEKDDKGNVKSWKHEGDWKKATGKELRGRVTNLSDKARRKTEKLSKPEKEMAEQFEKAMEGSIRGGVWTSQPPDKGQKDVPPPQEVDGGILNKKQPKPVNTPRPVKKAEVDTPTTVAATDGEEVTASMKRKGKQVDEVSHQAKTTMKHVKNPTAGEKKASKDIKAGTAGYKDRTDMLKSAEKDGRLKETLKGKQTELDVAEPKGKLTGADFKALKGKKKVKESTEAQLLRIAKQAMDTVKALREAKAEEKRIKNLPISESDEYFTGLQSRLNKQIKG